MKTGHSSGDRSQTDPLEADWLRLNATMLPEIDASFTEGYTGAQLADHLGVDTVPTKADDP